MKKHKQQEKYVKIKKTLLKKIVGYLYEVEDYTDFDFGDINETELYLKEIKKVADKAEILLYYNS
jgi:hypothetical protein